MGRWRSRTMLALTVVATVAACGGGGSGGGVSTIDGAPVRTDATTVAGGSLPNGLTVPEGTVLLGAVEMTGPTRSVNRVIVPERGWRALLLVTGDPYAVLDDVRAQAARSGMPASLMPTGCTTYPDVFECRVDAHSPGFVEHPARGAGLSAQITREPGGRDRPPTSHLLLGYSEVQPATHREPVVAPPPVDRTEPAPPFPDDWPALLRPGDSFGSISGETWVIEGGAELVGPPSYTAACATGGFDAVFEVTGDPQRVVDRYARQFEAAGFFPVDPDWNADVPGRGPSASFTAPGAGEVSAVTVEGPGDRSFLWLSRCND